MAARLSAKPTATTVDVRESDRSIFGPLAVEGTDTYRKSKLGVVTARSFEGEKVNRLYYRPSTSTAEQLVKGGEAKDYTIGHTSDQFQIIDHWEVIKPLLDLGYQLTKVHYHRGGLNMMAILQPAKAVTITDPLRWDLTHWNSDSDSQTLQESVLVRTGVKPGRGVHLNRGWFRLICTNGLVAEILNLGRARFSHTTWSPAALTALVKNEWPQMQQLIGNEVQALGPLIGSVKGLRKFSDILTEMDQTREAEDLFDEDEDGDEPVVRTRSATRRQATSRVAQALPLFIADELKTFSSTPSWMIQALAIQFALFADHAKRKDFYALDLVNAYTSAVNTAVAEAESRSAWRPLSRMDTSITSALKLIGGFSL